MYMIYFMKPLHKKLIELLPELKIHVLSRVIDLRIVEKVCRKSLQRALDEYEISIGDNYFYAWLEGIADSEIFGHSLEVLLPELRKHARFKVHDQNEAEDLVNQSVLKAIENEDQFDGNNLLAWTKTIMDRLLIDRLRKANIVEESFNRETKKKEKVYTKREEQMTELSQPSAEGGQFASLINEELWSCLKELKQENREIVLMKNKGFSYKDISKKFNKTINNLKQINLRSVKQLQICMGA